MKAVYITAQGGPEVMAYGERPDPVPGPGEVVVRVRACSVNRFDLWVRSGRRGTRREFPQPLVLGCDAAGEVALLGPGVEGVEVGAPVVVDPVLACGRCHQCLSGERDLCHRSGSLGFDADGVYAELVKVPAVNLHPMPPSLTWEEASALPTAYLPAWNMVVRRGRLRPWETALVLSASGGVGSAAVQIAKRVVGARVIATTSTPEKAEFVRGLGADAVVLYTEEDLRERVMELTGGRGVDLVVDHTGARFFEQAWAVLAVGGRYGVCGVTTGYLAQVHLGALFTRRNTLFGVNMGNYEDFRGVLEAASRGLLRPHIFARLPLREAPRAHRMMEEGAFFGKIVLTVG